MPGRGPARAEARSDRDRRTRLRYGAPRHGSEAAWRCPMAGASRLCRTGSPRPAPRSVAHRSTIRPASSRRAAARGAVPARRSDRGRRPDSGRATGRRDQHRRNAGRTRPAQGRHRRALRAPARRSPDPPAAAAGDRGRARRRAHARRARRSRALRQETSTPRRGRARALERQAWRSARTAGQTRVGRRARRRTARSQWSAKNGNGCEAANSSPMKSIGVCGPSSVSATMARNRPGAARVMQPAARRACWRPGRDSA